MKRTPYMHPGVILLEDFLTPLGVSQNALARAAKVPPRRINEIVLGKRSITPDTAVRLSVALGTSELFWMKLQAAFDLNEARDLIGRSVAEDRPEYALDDVDEGDWEAFLEALRIFRDENVKIDRDQPLAQVRESTGKKSLRRRSGGDEVEDNA